MKTRVKRRRVKRTRVKRRTKTRCRYKMRRNLKGGWGFPSIGGKDEQKEEQYGGWGEAVALV